MLRGLFLAALALRHLNEEGRMAAARDQAARILRPEPEAEGSFARDASAAPVDQPAAPAAPAAAADPAAPRSGRRKLVLMGIVTLLALAAAAYGVHYFLVGRFFVSTDDAYVRANSTTLGARVSGHIAAILPGDNAVVRAGEVIFKIDDGDYRIAVDAARTKIATQQATIDRIGRQVTALESAVEQAKAQLASADAGLKRAGLDFDRQQALSTRGFASRATFEVSEAGRDQGVAAVKSAQAAYDAARDNVEVTRAQQAEARAQLAELQTSLAKAERDLDFTTVGQPVTISVDAYGHRKFAGVVDSISPAAGSVFTLLPPDNATGNFTKIVQRLPVRVRVPKDVAKQNLLRAGMSVYTTVDTTAATDAESEADLDSPMMIHPQ